MNFWEEPHAWLMLICAVFAAVVACIIYPDPGWALLVALAGFSAGILIVMRATHWWEFEE